MPDASRPVFLRHFGRAAGSRPGPDWADMGTAFGLDEAVAFGGGPALVPHDPPPPVDALPVASWRLWLGRKLGA